MFRRKAKWVYWRENGIKRCKCSNCLTSYGCMDTPYCPNCGREMTGIVWKRNVELIMEDIDNNIKLSFLGGAKAGIEALVEGFKVVAENNNEQVSYDFIKLASENTIKDVEEKLYILEYGDELVKTLNGNKTEFSRWN